MKKPNRILIVKIGAMGDVIMALSLVDEIAIRDPEACITWIVGKKSSFFLRKYPSIKNIIEADELAIVNGSFLSKVKEVLRIIWKTKFSFFDLVITAHSDPRYRWLSWGVFAKKRVGLTKGTKEALVSGRYHGAEYAKLARFVNKKAPLERQVEATASFGSFPKEFFSPTSAGGVIPLHRVGSSYGKILLAPGGALNGACRRWPPAHYAKLATLLIASGKRVALIGDDNDRALLPFFSKIEIENWVGEFSLEEVTEAIKGSSLLITHDTGVLHIAELVGIPVIALFGPTNPAEKTKSSKTLVIWGGENLACRPCYDGKRYAPCPFEKRGLGHICLESIAPETVHDLAILKFNL